jgi:hypothetical protein
MVANGSRVALLTGHQAYDLHHVAPEPLPPLVCAKEKDPPDCCGGGSLPTENAHQCQLLCAPSLARIGGRCKPAGSVTNNLPAA